MKSMDDLGVIFVNALAARGTLNGVVNLTFSTFNFTPNESGEIDADPVVSCRLRMDKVCLYQTQKALTDLIALIEAQESGPVETIAEEPAKATGVSKRVNPEKTH